MRKLRNFYLVVAVAFSFLLTGSAQAQLAITSPPGISATVANTWTAPQSFIVDDAGTTTIIYPVINGHTSTGTPAATFGSGYQYVLENNSAANKIAGSTEVSWTDPVAGSEDSDFTVKLMTAGAAIASVLNITSTGLVSLLNTGILSFAARGRISSPVDGVVEAQSSASAGGYFRQAGGDSVLNANYTNATAAMSSTGLTKTVVIARVYAFDLGFILSDSTAADGFQMDFNGGTATMTVFGAGCSLVNDTQTANVVMTATTTISLAGVISATALTNTNRHVLRCSGSFVPSSTGTVIPRAARVGAVGGTVTILRGSGWFVKDVVAQ